MTCGLCGNNKFEKINAKGKRFVHLDEDNLELKFDLFLLTCINCENIVLSSKDIKELSVLLDKSMTSQNDTE